MSVFLNDASIFNALFIDSYTVAVRFRVKEKNNNSSSVRECFQNEGQDLHVQESEGFKIFVFSLKVLHTVDKECYAK